MKDIIQTARKEIEQTREPLQKAERSFGGHSLHETRTVNNCFGKNKLQSDWHKCFFTVFRDAEFW